MKRTQRISHNQIISSVSIKWVRCPVACLCSTGWLVSGEISGHTALVHTVAASNLGQMLNRVCLDEGVYLVNIVRKPEQETLLCELGAKYVCNSSEDTSFSDLTDALLGTGATLAFDATAGGWLLMPFLKKAGMQKVMELQARVATGLKTRFASHYSREISLAEALSLQAIAVYGKQATGEKFLIKPHQ